MKFRYLIPMAMVAIALLVVVPGYAQDDDSSMLELQTGSTEELGTFLTGPDGMSLYLFTNDEPGVSNCYDQCAENWPPLLAEDGETPVLPEDFPGRVGLIQREDESLQVTYNGWPLYYWVQDENPGDTTGHTVGDVWFVIQAPDVSLGGNEELGHFLVGPNGMTLYLFTNDEEGVTNCYDQCAENWPPLLVEDADAATMQPGLPGEVSTVERDDGTFQVAYDGWPLYYWVQDEAPGDATGHTVGDVWFVIQPPILNVSSDEELGDYLVGPGGMTLYLFTNDEEGVTNCYDQCAINWPPLLAPEGAELSVAEGIEGEVTLIEREDGTFQVAYNGVPLYYWIADVAPGDTTGHEVGDVWFVVEP